MTAFVFATGNADKAREVSEIFTVVADTTVVAEPIIARDGAIVGFAIVAEAKFAEFVNQVTRPAVAPDVAETGATLADNARIKARGVAHALGVAVVSDDTGLEVDALSGEPGVRSARYAGDAATAYDNYTKLLAEMTTKKRASRTARFVTVSLWYDPTTGRETVARGVAEGVIVDAPRGDHGFGYDPAFAPAGGGGRTFAEMSAAEKHALSHRGKAFRMLATKLCERL